MNTNKSSDNYKGQINQSQIILHCKNIVFLGKSFIKREKEVTNHE